MQAAVRLVCYHCADTVNDLVRGDVLGIDRDFCCRGCLEACRMIYALGEGQYYNTREAFPKKPEGTSAEETAYDMDTIFSSLAVQLSGGLVRLDLQISGIHCASCVYLNEQALRTLPGVESARVSYRTGRASITFREGALKPSALLARVRSIGYRAEPVKDGRRSQAMRREGAGLLWKLGLAGFGAGNTMIAAFAVWMGYFDGSMTTEFKQFFHWIEFALATPVFLVSAKIFHRGWLPFLRGMRPGMDVLVSAGISAAYFYSIYVVFTHRGEVYFDTVTTIVFVLLVGRYLEWRARYRRQEVLESLVRPLPPFAYRVDHAGKSEMIDTAAIRVGDLLELDADSVLPADGTLQSEAAELDESVLTGESLPVLRRRGDRVLAGSRITSGRVRIRVESVPAESALSALASMSEERAENAGRLEEITRRTVPVFSTIVLLTAIGSFAFFFFVRGAGFEAAMVTAISVLIVSCPCALALSLPSVVGSAIERGLSRGILVRDGSVLFAMGDVKSICFDKTGTLTRGQPSIVSHRLFESAEWVGELLQRMEEGTAHPYGRALLDLGRTLAPTTVDPAGDGVREEIPGRGMRLLLDRKEYRLGREEFAGRVPDNHPGIVLSEDGRVLGVFEMRDLPRPEAHEAVRHLRERGYALAMLTGDAAGPALEVGRDTGLYREEIQSGLFAAEKAEIVRRLSVSGAAMVGDGYNDAPAFAAATVSVGLARGAPLSLEKAGVILLKNDLSDIGSAFALSRRAHRGLRASFAFSLFYNAIMIPLAACGLMLPVWCALLMTASSLSVLAIGRVLRGGK